MLLFAGEISQISHLPLRQLVKKLEIFSFALVISTVNP